METYTFTGKVLPERAYVSISPIEINFNGTNTNFQGKLIISIQLSQISAVLKVETDQDLFTMKNTVEHSVRTLVDSYGYITKRGYDIEITSVVDTSNKQTVFGVGIPDLETATEEYPLDFSETSLLALKSKHLQHALGNLRDAIRSPWSTGFYCYRAIECVRQSFKEEGDSNERVSWERLNQNLRIDESYSKELTEFALPQRHGDMPEMTGEQRVRMMKHAWDIVGRYCLFLKKDNGPLSETHNILIS